jgi:hypothetical protein
MALKQTIAVSGVLAFLGTCVVVTATAFALVFVRVIEERRLSRWVRTASAWLFARGGLAFRHEPLARSEERCFCNRDRHLAFSVTRVDRTRTFAAGPNQTTAAEDF